VREASTNNATAARKTRFIDGTLSAPQPEE
jgi:hypothetical protein